VNSAGALARAQSRWRLSGLKRISSRASGNARPVFFFEQEGEHVECRVSFAYVLRAGWK